MFEEKLKTDSVIIIGKERKDKINLLYISALPFLIKNIKSNRREKVYEYNPFVIKSADKQKFSDKIKSDIDELKDEILSIRMFKDKISMLEKLTIVQLGSGEVFLVEELLTPYDKFGTDKNLKKRALLKEEQAKKIFRGGDFKKENLVYNKKSHKLLFTDVFPSKAHLI